VETTEATMRLSSQHHGSTGKAMAMASLCYGSGAAETFKEGGAFGCKLSRCGGGSVAAISGVKGWHLVAKTANCKQQLTGSSCSIEMARRQQW